MAVDQPDPRLPLFKQQPRIPKEQFDHQVYFSLLCLAFGASEHFTVGDHRLEAVYDQRGVVTAVGIDFVWRDGRPAFALRYDQAEGTEVIVSDTHLGTIMIMRRIMDPIPAPPPPTQPPTSGRHRRT